MYYDGKASYKSTGYRITSDQWHKKKNIPKDAFMLRNIETLISELKTFESEFRAINKTWCLDDFKRKDKPIPEPPQQVADRWHILKNLTEGFEGFLNTQRESLRGISAELSEQQQLVLESKYQKL